MDTVTGVMITTLWHGMCRLSYLKTCIPSVFCITRQIFAGAGKIGIETEAGLATPGHFQLTQRADFFHVEASVDTMHKRPIVNTRDEPHADPANISEDFTESSAMQICPNMQPHSKSAQQHLS